MADEFPRDGYQYAEDGQDFGDHYTPTHISDRAASRIARDENLPVYTSSAGVQWHMKTDQETGNLVIQGVQDVYALLEANKAMMSENDGWSKGEKFMRRAASIPAQLRLKWLIEEGFDAWRPDIYWDAIRRKLNDPDYRHLRTAHWRV